MQHTLSVPSLPARCGVVVFLARRPDEGGPHCQRTPTMIAPQQTYRSKQRPPEWHDDFLKMLPDVRRQATFAFRFLLLEAREEAVAETIANVLVAYARLVERGRRDQAYPSVLTRYAVAQIRSGRRVGTKLNRHEVLCRGAQSKQRFHVAQLRDSRHDNGDWNEFIAEDRRTPVPEQAAFRCDFPAWLATHSPRNRRIAERLAAGDSTSQVARNFKVSAGRVSQIRRELADSWHAFHGGGGSAGSANPNTK